MGNIVIDSSLFESELWTGEPFSKGQAWIDLIQMANECGVIHCSILKIADRWKWERRKVRRFISTLERLEKVTVKTTRKGAEICIVNYCEYQAEEVHGTTIGTTSGTTDGTTQTIEIPTFIEGDGTTSGTTNGTTDGTTAKKERDRERKKEKERTKEKESKKEIEKERNIYIYRVAEQVITYLNEQTGKHYRANTKEYLKLISARLREHYSVEDFKTVVDNKVADWKGTEYEQFLRPQTLFAPSKFDTYLNQGAKTSKTSNPFIDLLKGGDLNDITRDGEDIGIDSSILWQRQKRC